MADLEFSINDVHKDDPQAVKVQALVDEFKHLNHIPVSLQVYEWDDGAWDKFVKISLYGVGPVVSQTGDSWMGSLLGRNSLRVFKDRELAELNGEQNFLPSSWQSCLDFEKKNVVAVPWILDTYLIYYHRDLLEKAGIDEATAFSSLENFHETLKKLQENGMTHPFAMSTDASHSEIHTLASWVWGNGGNFTNPEGTQVLFKQPETRKGIRMFFDLFRFIPPEKQPLTEKDCLGLFLNRKVAVTMRNSALLFRLNRQEFLASVSENIATAVLPGVPFLGGSHLIIWNHIRFGQEENAIELIKFMTSTYAELALFEGAGVIPASLDALNQIDLASPFEAAIESVKKGRNFNSVRMWGLVEDKLIHVMPQMWSALLNTSSPDVDQVISNFFDPIEDRLNITLSK